MDSKLAQMECVPCKEGALAMKLVESRQLASKIGGHWNMVNEHHLEREFTFPDFRTALDFTNRVGELAEKVGHHPDVYLAWGKVKLKVWTHKVDGLTENDFIFAAKVNHQLAKHV